MWLIFDTKGEANSVLATLNDAVLPSKSGISTNYGQILKHPTEQKWALYVLEEDMHLIQEYNFHQVQELDESWQEAIDSSP